MRFDGKAGLHRAIDEVAVPEYVIAYVSNPMRCGVRLPGCIEAPNREHRRNAHHKAG